MPLINETKIKTNKSLIITLKKALVFVFVAFIGYVMISENFFDYAILTGLPIKNIGKLFIFHIVANSALALSVTYLGYLFVKLYFTLKARNVPFVGFLWIFGCFKFFMALIFIMNIVSVWRAYYWIDGTIRVLAAVFSIAAAIALAKSFKEIVNIKSPEEYQQLKDELTRLSDIQKEVIKVKPDKNG